MRDAYGAEIEPSDRSVLDASWAWRRTAVIVTSAYSMVMLAALAIWGEGASVLHQSIAVITGGVWSSVLGIYIGGAVVDDRNRRQAWSSIETTRIRASGVNNPPPAPGRLDGVTG